MPYLEAETYRAREQQWRGEASRLSPCRERDACLALAEGYANLVQLIGRLAPTISSSGAASSETAPAHISISQQY
jgi:hypothetical protein